LSKVTVFVSFSRLEIKLLKSLRKDLSSAILSVSLSQNLPFGEADSPQIGDPK